MHTPYYPNLNGTFPWLRCVANRSAFVCLKCALLLVRDTTFHRDLHEYPLRAKRLSSTNRSYFWGDRPVWALWRNAVASVSNVSTRPWAWYFRSLLHCVPLIHGISSSVSSMSLCSRAPLQQLRLVHRRHANNPECPFGVNNGSQPRPRKW